VNFQNNDFLFFSHPPQEKYCFSKILVAPKIYIGNRKDPRNTNPKSFWKNEHPTKNYGHSKWVLGKVNFFLGQYFVQNILQNGQNSSDSDALDCGDFRGIFGFFMHLFLRKLGRFENDPRKSKMPKITASQTVKE
jgi:hypothetical protein